MDRLPLIAPNPPRLTDHLADLARVEASGVFSNNGPEVRAFEAEATAQLFDGHGASLAVANATLGLMIAIRDAAGERVPAGACALMPALTFAATAQAAFWAGLVPLVCDIDLDGWSAAAGEEERILRNEPGRVRVLVPYATFGNVIDLDRYRWLQRRYGVGVVVDAASSLGSRDEAGRGFGADAPFAVVHSLHATKTFAVGEGGLVHSGDEALIARLRAMANFGFDSARSAVLPGLNAKMAEVTAVAARAKLREIDAICDHRAALEARYRTRLDGVAVQRVAGQRRAMQFMAVRLPAALAPRRDAIARAMAAEGVETGRYFSPHLGEQPWVRRVARIEPTPVADAVAGAMLSLPITDAMTLADVDRAAAALRRACAAVATLPAAPRSAAPSQVMIVGGGPAGTAVLTAASKAGRLRELARGLTIVERDAGLGGGRLGQYAITSDSTAATFLSAVKDNPEPAIAALADHPVAAAVARHDGALGVPLTEAGPLLRATGEWLGRIAAEAGADLLTGHEAVGARCRGGLWEVSLRRLADGTVHHRRTAALVIATGGHQPLDRLAEQEVAGARLATLASGRLIQSDELLALGGLERVEDLLAGRRAPRVAVIGGSTSALTSVVRLLRSPALALGPGAVTLLHRRPLRPFYPSAEAARAEGFTDFGEADICPVSGFVYRLAGFRLEARELVLRLLGVDGRAAEPRVATHRIAGDDLAARAILERADLVVAGLGYRPRALPLADAAGQRIALAADRGGSMVDRDCRVLDAEGAPLPGVWGIGLAAGFVPWGRLGGEASFRGQANGLWLWQNDVGQMIVDQLLDQTAGALRPSAVA